MITAAVLVLSFFYQIDGSGDGTGDESGDKIGDDAKDSVPQSKFNYACTFPLQGIVTYLLHIECVSHLRSLYCSLPKLSFT